MKISEIISEGVSSVLYHCTSFPGAISVLDTDVLGKVGVPVSFSRSAYGAYHRDNKLIGVIFEINGQKLSHRHSGAPVGGENWEYNKEDYDVNDKDTWEFQGKTGQFEDRVNGPIKNISLYIKRAIIYVPEEYISKSHEDGFRDNYAESSKHIMKCISLLESKNIPVQYVIKESQLGKNVQNSVTKKQFVDMILKNNTEFVHQLPDSMKPNANWIVFGATMYDNDELDDEGNFEIKFRAPVTNKQELIKFAVAAARKQHTTSSIYISYIENKDNFRQTFEIDQVFE